MTDEREVAVAALAQIANRAFDIVDALADPFVRHAALHTASLLSASLQPAQDVGAAIIERKVRDAIADELLGETVRAARVEDRRAARAIKKDRHALRRPFRLEQQSVELEA